MGSSRGKVQDQFVVTLKPGITLQRHFQWIGLDFSRIDDAHLVDFGRQSISAHMPLQMAPVWRYRVRLIPKWPKDFLLYDPHVLAVWGVKR